MEYVRDIASLVSLVIAIFTMFSLLTTHGHDFLTKIYKKHNAAILENDQHQNDQIKYLIEMVMNLAERSDINEAVAQQNLRDKLKTIYYRYCDKKIIPLYERKTADSTYKIYSEKLNGNSYAKLIYDEIVSWDIDPTGHVPEDDEDGEKV